MSQSSTAVARPTVSAIEVRRLEEPMVNAWNDYVQAHLEGTFFHLAQWRDVLGRAFGHPSYHLCAIDSGGVRGVLPLVHVRSLLFGNALTSTPCCVYGGALADTDEIASLLEDKAAALAEGLGVDYLELRNRSRQRVDWPTKDLYVTFRKAILPTVDENMKAIPRKQRAMVRKGIDAGLAGVIDDDVDRFFRIYAESVRNHGTPVFSRSYFRILKEVFGERCEVLTAVRDSEPVSSVMSFYFRDEVLPYYGGGLPVARSVKGFDFLYWDLMRRACERGLRTFDYGRSKLGTGSYSFKKNWGFEPTPLPYQYHLVRAKAVPEVNPLNPKYRVFIEMWKRLPVPVANFVGPFLARGLG